MLGLFDLFTTKGKTLAVKSTPKFPLPSLSDIGSLAGQRVLLRASLNVPIENGSVFERFRIEQALPTIQYLKERGARVIIVGHIGREPQESLLPVYEVLRELIGAKWGGKDGEESSSALADGEVLLMENLRRDPRESANEDSLAKELASLADFYVNDAFSDSHREHASIVGVPKYLPTYFGHSFVREYKALLKVMEPEHPALFILGGAKFETKMPLVVRYATTYDHVFIGGALANDVFKAKGYEVGRSLVSDVDLQGNEVLLLKNLIVPTDVVTEGGEERREVGARGVVAGEAIFDVGPVTLKKLAPLVQEARTILWNGPLGNFEKGFSFGTETLARMVADSSAYSVVGGGDTIAAIRALGLEERFGFMSTAGGAMLVFLETGTLPAIKAVLG